MSLNRHVTITRCICLHICNNALLTAVARYFKILLYFNIFFDSLRFIFSELNINNYDPCAINIKSSLICIIPSPLDSALKYILQ